MSPAATAAVESNGRLTEGAPAADAAQLAEAQALQVLRDAVIACGLPPGRALAIFSAASAYGKAAARRMAAVRLEAA